MVLKFDCKFADLNPDLIASVCIVDGLYDVLVFCLDLEPKGRSLMTFRLFDFFRTPSSGSVTCSLFLRRVTFLILIDLIVVLGFFLTFYVSS